MSVAVGTPAAIGQPLNSAFLITIKDLVTSFTGDAKLPAKCRHAFASEPPSHKLQSLIHHRTLLPRHSLPPQKGKKCNPCVRYNLLPMCRVAHGSWCPLLEGPLHVRQRCRASVDFFGIWRYLNFRARYPSGKGEVCKTFMRRFDSDPRLHRYNHLRQQAKKLAAVWLPIGCQAV